MFLAHSTHLHSGLWRALKAPPCSLPCHGPQAAALEKGFGSFRARSRSPRRRSSILPNGSGESERIEESEQEDRQCVLLCREGHWQELVVRALHTDLRNYSGKTWKCEFVVSRHDSSCIGLGQILFVARGVCLHQDSRYHSDCCADFVDCSPVHGRLIEKPGAESSRS